VFQFALLCNTALTLSAYLIQIVSTYFKGVRDKARRMNYGLSKVVDILSVTLDYQHENSENCRSELYRALTSIGHYGLTVVSTITPHKSHDEVTAARREVFRKRGLNHHLLTSLPPKQALHVVRLAILQTISEERKDGCLLDITTEDFVDLRSRLNDYCGGASQVSSSITSSKLPYSYVNLVNWAVKTLTFFYTATFYSLSAEDWYMKDVCLPMKCDENDREATAGMWVTFLWFNIFQLIMLYFLFGILEVYVTLNDTWQSGLVLENYLGIIDMICEPLNRQPLNVRQLSNNSWSNHALLGKTGQLRKPGQRAGSIARPLLEGGRAS